MIAILKKYEHNQDFHQIVDFVRASHIRIETTEEGTMILATVDGKLRTVFESSIRRNLKLNDEAGISSLPDVELFENLQLMGYNILPNQKFTFQKGQFSRQWKYLIHIMQCLSPKSTGFNEFSSNIATALVCLATNRVRTRIAQSLVLLPMIDEPASSLGDDSQGEACPTDSGFEVDQDRANIAKTFTLPSDSTPRVTSLAADEGTQELEINSLKARIKLLEDKDRGVAEQSRDDALIKGRRLDEGEEAAERVSDDTEEMAIRMNEQIARYAEIARIHAEEELQMLIDGFDRNNETSWKARHFKGMTLEEIKEKFDPMWKQWQDFIPIGSKEEVERFKRKGLKLEQESMKKLKTSEEVKATEEVPKEKVKEMMQLAPVEEIYNLMHALVEWKLYDTRRFHHVTSKDKEIFMLVEKDYLLKKGLAIVMISYKLQVENYSQMENDLILKIYKIAIPKLAEARSSKRDTEEELKHEGSKKQKTSEASGSAQEQPGEEEKELSQEDLQQLMIIVLEQGMNVEALQTKYPIINWEIYTEDTRKDDLVQLWSLVKESFSSTKSTDDKEKVLWVELKRLFEPDTEDELWEIQRRHLKLEDSDGISTFPNTKIFKQLALMGAAKVLVEVAKVYTCARRRRAISTASGGISTAEELVSTVGASIPVSTAGMVDKDKAIMPESEPEQTTTKLQQRQERAGYEAAVRLQERLDEEERQRISRVHEEASSFNVDE
nr:hypothetical protein [Tanacetum cinerariifolium]